MIVLELERRKQGLSQEALGEKINYTGAMVCLLECGRIEKPGKRFKAALENYFKKPFDELVRPLP